jgi:hypothetical protein
MKLLEFPHSHYCEKARWALDQNYPSRFLTPNNADQRRLCLEIEQMVDKRLGVNIRRVLKMYREHRLHKRSEGP